MSMIPVNSSAIAAIGYEDGTLFVLFRQEPQNLPAAERAVFIV